MVNSKHQTFKTLDHPSRILFWKADEFLIMVIPIFLAIALGYFLILFGAFLRVPYNRLKKRFSPCSLSHYAYWYLPTKHMKFLKRMPPTHIREFLL